MTPFDCRPLTPAQLAVELSEGEVVASRAVPGATVYDLKTAARRWLVVALPNGNGLSIDQASPPPRRRRADISSKPNG
ncbi:hypothetical protein MASR1M60_24930 [Rhodocyclaceae bacterium]